MDNIDTNRLKYSEITAKRVYFHAVSGTLLQMYIYLLFASAYSTLLRFFPQISIEFKLFTFRCI